MDAMFRKQSSNSSKVLDSELLSGGKHGLVAGNVDHKVAENECRLRMKANGDGNYIEINTLKNCSMRQFPVSLPLNEDSGFNIEKSSRDVTGIRMHVTCHQGANRMRRH